MNLSEHGAVEFAVFAAAHVFALIAMRFMRGFHFKFLFLFIVDYVDKKFVIEAFGTHRINVIPSIGDLPINAISRESSPSASGALGGPPFLELFFGIGWGSLGGLLSSWGICERFLVLFDERLQLDRSVVGVLESDQDMAAGEACDDFGFGFDLFGAGGAVKMSMDIPGVLSAVDLRQM